MGDKINDVFMGMVILAIVAVLLGSSQTKPFIQAVGQMIAGLVGIIESPGSNRQ